MIFWIKNSSFFNPLQARFLTFLDSCFGKLAAVVILGVYLPSCEQYEYTSPLPGLLEVRLRAVNNRQGLIPFSSSNLFVLTLETLEAKRDDNARLLIFADEYAIRRNSTPGDFFNCLDTLARDSALILGRTFAPPGVFRNIEFRVLPSPLVIVWNGFFVSFIEVVDLERQTLHTLPRSGQQLNIRVEENRLTRVTVTVDLDSSLVQRTETFEYRPYFYVSSIENF